MSDRVSLYFNNSGFYLSLDISEFVVLNDYFYTCTMFLKVKFSHSGGELIGDLLFPISDVWLILFMKVIATQKKSSCYL